MADLDIVIDPYKTDVKLLEEIKDWKNEKAWNEFYNKYKLLIMKVAARIGVREADREDIVNGVMKKISEDIVNFTYDPEKKYRNRVFTIAKNHILRRISNKKEQMTDTVDPVDMPKISGEHDTEFMRIWDDEYRQFVVGLAYEMLEKKMDKVSFQIFKAVANGENSNDVAKQYKVQKQTIYNITHAAKKLLEVFGCTVTGLDA